jgi:hypothetical protein
VTFKVVTLAMMFFVVENFAVILETRAFAVCFKTETETTIFFVPTAVLKAVTLVTRFCDDLIDGNPVDDIRLGELIDTGPRNDVLG